MISIARVTCESACHRGTVLPRHQSLFTRMWEKLKTLTGGKRREAQEDPFASLEDKRSSALGKMKESLSRAYDRVKKGDAIEVAKVGAVAGGILGASLVAGMPGYVILMVGAITGTIGKELYDDYVQAAKKRGIEPEPLESLQRKIEEIHMSAGSHDIQSAA